MSRDDSFQTASNAEVAAIRQLLTRVPLIDGHNDAAWQLRERFGNRLDAVRFVAGTEALTPPMHTDLERLKAGGVGAQFWSVYLSCDEAGPGAVRALLEQIDVVHRVIEAHPQHLEFARTADDIERIHRAGGVASLIGIEGGHSIDGSLAVLRQAYVLGARYMTLTHARNTPWADSATDESQHGGLTEFGRAVIAEMNRLGMLVDLAHVSAETMQQALETSQAPVLFTHSSARAVTDHPRNVPDDILARVAATGSVVMVTFVPAFVSEAVRAHDAAAAADTERIAALHAKDETARARALERWHADNPRPSATIDDVADHIEHVRRVAGADHVGIGSDFDGVDVLPEGLEDVTCYPRLLVELGRRGWTTEDLEKLAGRNVLRVMRTAEGTAQALRSRTRPSEARLASGASASPTQPS